jgi:hypothetical protein
MGSSSLPPDQLTRIVLDALVHRQSVASIVLKYDLPEWVVSDAIVRAVQGMRGLFGQADADGSELRLADRRFRFIHIEKTAGTSLTAWLDDFFDQGAICPDQVHEALVERAKTTDLRQYRLIRGHFFLGWFREFEYDDGRSSYITFLREPVERQISFYNHWMYDRSVRDALNPLLHWQNIQTTRLSPLSLRHGYASMREHLDAAKEALESFFFVGLQERLDDSVRALAALLGAPACNSLPALNLTSKNAETMRIRSVSASDLSQTLLDEIRSNNWADIELYGHALSLFESRFSVYGRDSGFKSDAVDLWPPRASVEFRMDQEIRGSGWWFREGLDGALGQSWRWSGPGLESLAIFHLASASDYALSVRVVNAITPEVLASLEVMVNGQTLQTTRRQDAKWGVLVEGTVLRESLGPDVPNLVVCLRVASVHRFNAIDPTSTDDRLCGIAVSEINLTPI